MTESTPAGLVSLPPIPAFAAPGRAAPSLRGAVDWQRATVVEVRRETPNAVTVRLALPVWNAHVAGQHYMLRLTAADGYTAQRHYSVASAPDDEGHIEFTVDRVPGGEVSGFVHDVARPGDVLEVRGPLGGFFAWPGDRPVLLVAGGSGLVPLMAMVRHRRRRALSVPLRLVACARTPQDLLYAAELAPLPGEEHTVLYSRAAPPGYPHPVGRLTPDTLAPHAAAAVADERCEVFVCGSTGFAEHAGRLLTSAGVPRTRIRVERFG
ncbi:ferredoxin reductase [Embleya sp. MST-111070]|uniref:ferredoxin reductase n=1 Tax=Embleya sp. MST-111070 TaxID=3398231 RepID=UPI003F73949D